MHNNLQFQIFLDFLQKKCRDATWRISTLHIIGPDAQPCVSPINLRLSLTLRMPSTAWSGHLPGPVRIRHIPS